MLSHQLEQNRIDGEKTIIQNPSEAQRKEHEKFDFSVHEVNLKNVLKKFIELFVRFMP